MNKIKRIIVFIIFMVIIVANTLTVKAVESFKTNLVTNNEDIKKGEEVEVTLSFENFQDINKGLNAYKATLEYDSNVFEKVTINDFESLNSWQEFLYNENNHEFVAIKKSGSKSDEDIIKVKLRAKQNIKPGQTIIKVKDVVTSEGKKDIFVGESQVLVNLMEQQNSQNPVVPGDSGENNNSQGNNSDLDNLLDGKLPQTGVSSIFLPILLIIEILLVIIAINSYIKMKKLDKKVKSKGKMLMVLVTTSLLTMQVVSTIYAVSTKGELNGDGKINYADVTLLEQHLIDLKKLPKDKLTNADMNSDNELTITDLALLVQKIENSLDYKVEISSNMEEFYYNKNQEIELKFSANVSYGAEIEKVIIHKQEYPVEKEQDTNHYVVKIILPNQAGIQEYKFSKVILNVGKEEKVDFTEKLEVLKDIPQIQNYKIEQLVNEAKMKVSFDVIDEDSSITNANIELRKKKGNLAQETVKQENIKVGNNEFILDLEENQDYDFNIYINYNLDTDSLTEHEKDNTGVIVDSKELKLNINYQFTIDNIKTYNQQMNETDIFSKNEPIIVAFDSTNTTKYKPKSIVINGQNYKVQESNGTYIVNVNAITETGDKEIVIEKIVLENGKEFVLDKDNKIIVKVQKEKPKVQNVKIEEEQDGINIAFNIKDTDNTIVNKKLIIKNAEGKILTEKELSSNDFSEKISLPEELTTEYKVEVIASYDLTTDNTNLQEGRVIYEEIIKAKTRVIIENAELSKTKLEKNEDITIAYTIKSNKQEDVQKVIVNHIEGSVIKIQENKYEVTIPVGNTPGRQNLVLSKVIFSDEEISMNYSSDIEILKSKPIVENYQAEDDYNNEKVLFDFEIKDDDNTFVSGKVQLVKENNEIKEEQPISNASKLHFELPVIEKEEYWFKVMVTYARDEDGIQLEEDVVLLEKPIQMIANYELEISNIETKKEDEDTNQKYFNRNQKIKLTFTSTNVTKFIPEKAMVNGKSYDLQALGDNQYETLIDGFGDAGVKDITIEKFWMNNTKELEIKENNHAQVEILKLTPSVINFEYEEIDNNNIIKVQFEIVDNEDSLLSSKIAILDANGVILEKGNLTKGINEVEFKMTTSEDYTVKILADYDLDTNALSNGENEYSDVKLLGREINAVQELIELKDIESVILYTKNGEEVEEVEKIETDNFNPENYLAKVSMKYLPTFYAEIEQGLIEGNNFNLILKYDNIVQYNGNNKSNKIKVKFGEITDGVASNIGFDDLIDIVTKNPTAEITLTNDLDAKSVSVSTTSYLGNFKGIIHGNGHTIKNLNRPLCGDLVGATIEGLIIENANVSGANRGIIANYSYGTTIRDVHIKNSSISSRNNGVGIFIGTGEHNMIIENCSANNVQINGPKMVGGFVGFYSDGSAIKNSYTNGKVTGSNDAIGGIIGQTSSSTVTLENVYAKVQLQMNKSYANAGIIGYAERNNITLINVFSLADGNMGTRVIGTTTKYTGQSKNNYELEESKLSSNNNDNQVKVVSKTNINTEFFKDTLKWDENIWRLDNISFENLPTLKNTDPTDIDNVNQVIHPNNENVYIPQIERLRNMSNYDASKEIAYHNMNVLMPFYDAKLFIEYGNKIENDDILNQKMIKIIIPYNKNNEMIVGLNSNNYSNISKIKLIFEDEQVREYKVTFKNKLSDVATYKVDDLNIGYTYNQFILNTDISLVNEIINLAKGLDYKTQIQNVTPEDESRLYVDYYNESVKGNIGNIITYVLSNETEYNLYLDNEILEQKIRNEILTNSGLEKIIYSFNYFDKWYHMEIGGIPLTNVIFLNVHNLNNDMTIKDLISQTISQPQNVRATNNTIGFYNNVIKRELTGNKNIGQFLEYFMKTLAGYTDGNKWFKDKFKGILNEKPAVGKETTIRYQAWALLKAKNTLLLPVLSAPQEDMYIISVPSQLVIGSMNRYDQHLKGDVEGMRKLIDDYATMIGNFYGISSTFIKNAENILNSHVHIQYDTRFYFKNGTQESGTTQDPVIKWLYEAVGAWAKANGSGAYANGTDVYWVVYPALGGNFSFSVFSHETAHNQDGYYFYEGYGRRLYTWAEDHADANIAQDLGNGSFVFNIRGDIAVTADDSNNLKLDRISSPEKIYSYYKEMFETYYVLDYLTGQAFLQLTPEEQAKLGTQVVYDNGTNYEEGGQSTTYTQKTAEDFRKMNLKTMEDLWDNGIVFRVAGTVSGNSPGSYGGDNHYNIYWYQPHNNSKRPDSYTFKRLGFEMLGIGGYSDGYVTYRSRKSENDLDAIRKITKDDTMTWKKYKMNRYQQVENNLHNIPYFNAQEVITLYKQALEKDAKNGNRNNTNNLRKVLFGMVKRATKDFETGTIYDAGKEVEIYTAQQLIDTLNSAEWGNYKLMDDLDFSNIIPDEKGYITKTFVGRINGNNHQIKGLKANLFDNMVYAEIQDLVIKEPYYSSDVSAILANSAKNLIVNNVSVNSVNINIPFVKTNNGLTQLMGSTTINVKNNPISTIEELLAINTNSELSGKMSYELTSDIDVSSVIEGNAIIKGTFSGKLNGNGHRIINMKLPLFENISGIVSNLKIENVEMIKSKTASLGAIAKQSKNAILENIKVDNVIIEGSDNSSAIVGVANSTTFNKISATNILIKGTHYYAGGIVGRSFDSKYKDILVSGKLQVKDTHNGGVIGAINRDNLENVYVDMDIERYSNGDNRNKNGGLYGAIEKGPIGIKNVVVIGNVNENMYKITPATNETEIGDIGKYLINVYEFEESTGISNADISSNIKKVTSEELRTENFYINSLGWNKEIWNFSMISSGGLPEIK